MQILPARRHVSGMAIGPNSDNAFSPTALQKRIRTAIALPPALGLQVLGAFLDFGILTRRAEPPKVIRQDSFQ